MRSRKSIIAFVLVLFLTLGTFISASWIDVYATGTKFKIGEDNNNFVHSRGAGGGFEGYNSYYISNERFASLLSLASYSEKVKLIKERNKTWGGSCHGIATTMALVKSGYKTAADISSKGAPNYYSIGKPRDDIKFMSWINYYQLIQNISGFSCSSYAHDKWPLWNSGHTYNNLGDFIYGLRKASNSAEFGYVRVLSYFYSGNNESYGHSILITGYRESNGSYIVELYDENKSKKIDMTTRTNDNWFEFVDGRGNRITPVTCTNMYIGEPVQIIEVSSLSSMEVNDSTKLSFGVSDSFELVDGTGKTLTVNNGEVSGDLPIEDIDYYVCDEDSELIIKTDSIESATITNLGDDLCVELYDNNEFRSVEGDNIDTVTFGGGGEINLSGSDYSFKAFVGVGSSDDYDVGVGSISATATGTVEIGSDSEKITAASDTIMTDIETGIYKDENKRIEQQEDSKEIVADVQNGVVDIDPDSEECNHEWDNTYTTDTAATCTSNGSESLHCKICGTIKAGSSRIIYTSGHKFGAWNTKIPATEMNAGQQIRVCSVCDKTETRAIAQLAPTLKKVKISKPKGGKKSATVKWKKIKKKDLKTIKQVQIQYSTDPNFSSGVKTISVSAKKTSKKIKIPKGVTYYVRVRAYNGGHVSAWSGKKPVKAK